MAKFSKLILILLISFCFSLKTEAKNPPPGTGTSDIPANILIMLDNSGSMSARLYNSVEVYYPSDVSTDSSGNIYVMEFLHNRIKVFDSAGNYKRSIGSYGWGCNQWRYSYQFEIYNDKIYLTDFYNQRLKVLDLNGRCLNNVYVNGRQPTGIAVSSNYTFVRFRGYYSERTWI